MRIRYEKHFTIIFADGVSNQHYQSIAFPMGTNQRTLWRVYELDIISSYRYICVLMELSMIMEA